LKNYASLLGLPADEILAGYAAVAAPSVATVAPSTVRLRTTESAPTQVAWAPIAGGVAAALVLAGLLWFKPWHSRTAAPMNVPEPIAAAAAAAAVPPSAGPSMDSEQASSSTATEVPPATVLAPAVAATATAAPAADAPGSGRARLRLSFSADSWVEVSNAAGQRVFAGYGHANTVKSIAGSAPLRVYLKQAGGVQLEVNERAVAIAPQFVTGNVARFEAGADGVLRRDAHSTREHD
jgi:cytoskeletal protein RodZ